MSGPHNNKFTPYCHWPQVFSELDLVEILGRAGKGQVRQRQTRENIVSQVILRLGISAGPGVVVKTAAEGRLSSQGAARRVGGVLKSQTQRKDHKIYMKQC